MMSGRSAQNIAEYAGCRLFLSSSGLCGVALGTEGQHAGFLYDFFATPHEDIRAVYGLMDMVLDLGANKLTIYANSFLASFFEQFGFEAVCILPGQAAPSDWVPESCRSASSRIACPDFVFMARKIYQTSAAVTSWMSRVQHLPRASSPTGGPEGPCASCAAPIGSETNELFSAYQCGRCGFIYVCGTLTMGVPRNGQAAR
jgi:hypothetical protein